MCKEVGPQPVHNGLQLQSVSRISSIPLVESGLQVGEKIYYRIRESNPLIRWYLSTAESSVKAGVACALPAVTLLEKPISTLDRFLCKSLDVVEQKVPSVYLPPETLYTNTRRYVMRRADSVKQLGTAVLDSRVTAVTAVALDRALSTADKYVDRYLPPDNQDVADGPEQSAIEVESGLARAQHTMQHGARLRRKLQRRLTRQALAEAKAIKEQIHVLVYIAELVATDPAQAWRKARETYASLSGPEPENQARPGTLEELVVLLAREAARRLVHLINFTAGELPRNLKSGVHVAATHVLNAAETLVKTTKLETAKSALHEVKTLRCKIEAFLQELRSTSKIYLEHLAMFLAGNEEREKILPRPAAGETGAANGDIN